ncbi:hypothetical protein GCM10023189_33270 [Nibrella saemangeumensis]|uniref:3-keto-alpha-glucoside-1,2-lyase/3-keto-2-hydroxy-glucal hydratase domain-containing protein n=1 Tax=Nibrella saemangeumensis TaxID=1084526 RepID=A0ABP8N426_9BACT
MLTGLFSNTIKTCKLLLATFALLTLSIACAQIPPKKHPKTSGKGWTNLFKADLSNATYPKGVWSLTNGELTATEDKSIWTRRPYNDFILDLEFKTAPGTNSGVIVYASDTVNWIPNSVEIQIADDYSEEWRKSPAYYQCAAIFGHKAATKQNVVKQPGAWNRYTITCQGKKIWVVLNNQLVNTIDLSEYTSAKKNPDGTDIPNWLSKPLSSLPTQGYIGFQGKHAGAPIWFRNIRVQEL